MHSTSPQQLKLSLLSFAYKFGLPADANIVFDARFLKNPYYEPDLQKLTGLDAAVGPHIESDPDFPAFYAQLTTLLLLLLPRYAERDTDFSIAIGCTGGQHRSVYIVEKLGGFLSQAGYKVDITHRELDKV